MSSAVSGMIKYSLLNWSLSLSTVIVPTTLVNMENSVKMQMAWRLNK